MYEAAVEAHDRDPLNNPKPPNLMNYDFYLPQSHDVHRDFRRSFDVEDPAHNGSDGSDGTTFQFNRVRGYETAQETELDHPTKYEDEIILAYNDDDEYPKQKAMYYYPVMQKSAIRPQRTKNIARTSGLSQEGDDMIINQLDISILDPTEEMRDAMKNYKEKPLGWDQGGEEPEPEPEQGQQYEDADGDERPRRSSEAGKSDPKSPEEDRDAEGEDEDEDEED